MPSTIWEFKGKTNDLDQKLKSATNNLADMSEEAKRVNATFSVCDEQTLQFTRALGNMSTSAVTTRGKLNELTTAATEVAARYKQLTDEEKQSPYGIALRESMDRLNERVRETRSSFEEARNEIGATGEQAGGLSGIIGNLTSKFGVNIGTLSKFGIAAGSVTAALKVGKDAFFRQESGIDSWGSAMEAAKGVYNTFVDTLNNGNWSNFLTNLNTALNNSIELYNALDSLGSIKANNAVAIAMAERDLAALRVRKQNGEAVDGLIRQTESVLTALRSQQVNAGKKAGVQGIRNEITSRYNTVDGVKPISYGSVTNAIKQITERGQAYFDEMKNTFETLTQKGTRTKTGYAQWGSSYVSETRVFDINLLSDSEKKMYALAKAVTEGETSIQNYTSVIKSAIDEERNASRDTYKYNRIANAGSGRNNSSGKGSTSNTDEEVALKVERVIVKAFENLDFGNPARAKYDSMISKKESIQSQLANVQDPEMRSKLNLELSQITGRMEDMEMPDGMRMDAGGLVIPLNFSIDQSALKSQSAVFDGMVNSTQQSSKSSGETAKAWRQASAAISNAGNAMQMMQNPAAKVAGIIMQAVANVALGFASALASPATSAAGIFGWIAAATAGLATMVATIASVKSATKMAEGGIVGGSSMTGDRLLTRINSGEMVINRADQQRLWETIQGGGISEQTVRIEGRLSGEDIYISQKAYRSRTGKR